jgi:hypothetical protein
LGKIDVLAEHGGEDVADGGCIEGKLAGEQFVREDAGVRQATESTGWPVTSLIGPSTSARSAKTCAASPRVLPVGPRRRRRRGK